MLTQLFVQKFLFLMQQCLHSKQPFFITVERLLILLYEMENVFINKFNDKTHNFLLLLGTVYVMSIVDSFVAKSAYDINDVFINVVVCGVVVAVVEYISAKSTTIYAMQF